MSALQGHHARLTGEQLDCMQKVNKFLQSVPGKPQVAGPPAQRDFGIQSAVFGVLAATILIQVGAQAYTP